MYDINYIIYHIMYVLPVHVVELPISPTQSHPLFPQSKKDKP